MHYAAARYAEDQKHKSYKIYVTDALKAITENTARTLGGGYIKTRWADVLEQKPADTRTGEEIAADVIKKAGLVVKTHESI